MAYACMQAPLLEEQEAPSWAQPEKQPAWAQQPAQVAAVSEAVVQAVAPETKPAWAQQQQPQQQQEQQQAAPAVQPAIAQPQQQPQQQQAPAFSAQAEVNPFAQQAQQLAQQAEVNPWAQQQQQPQVHVHITQAPAVLQQRGVQADVKTSRQREKKEERCLKPVSFRSVLGSYRSMLADGRPAWQKALIIFPGCILLLISLILSFFFVEPLRFVKKWVLDPLFGTGDKGACCGCCPKRCCGMKCCTCRCICWTVCIIAVVGGLAFGILWLMCRNEGAFQCFAQHKEHT